MNHQQTILTKCFWVGLLNNFFSDKIFENSAGLDGIKNRKQGHITTNEKK